jgi:hypothetical protein
VRLELEVLEARTVPSVLANVNTDTEGAAGSAPHNETTLAVNPTNPLNLIGSANDYQQSYNAGGQLQRTINPHAHVSFDGGQTWTEYPIPFSQSQMFDSDPGVAFDADGTAYLSVVTSHGPNQVPGTYPDLVVTHSADGGKTWSNPVLVALGRGAASSAGVFNDKPYIVAWGHGNAIVTWAEFNYGPQQSITSVPILASVTHDGGNTWSAPVPISGAFTITWGSVPVVAADGSIYVSFIEGDEVPPEYRDHWEVVKVDPNTGQALGVPVEVGLDYDGLHDYPLNVNGSETFQDSEFREGYGFGNITADPSNALHLAVVWSDMRNSPYLTSTDPYQVKTNSDIVVSQSFDGGVTWSAPIAIQQPNDQFQPWAAYDATGHLHIGYYDRSYDPANHKYGYTLASEMKPGALKFTLQELSTALSDPTQGDAFFTVTVNSNFPNATTFMGDYSAIAVTPTGVDALWTDMRLPATLSGFSGSGEDIFFADQPTGDSTAGVGLPASRQPVSQSPVDIASSLVSMSNGPLPAPFAALGALFPVAQNNTSNAVLPLSGALAVPVTPDADMQALDLVMLDLVTTKDGHGGFWDVLTFTKSSSYPYWE